MFDKTVKHRRLVRGRRPGGRRVEQREFRRAKFFDPDNGLDLLSLAEVASQPTIPATGLPKNSDGVETSAALLAEALQQRPGTTVAPKT